LTGKTAPKSIFDSTNQPATAIPRAGRTLASVPTFEDTQQKWEDPAPYGEASNQPTTQSQQQNALKEPLLVFVRSVTQSSGGALSNTSTSIDATPRLDLTPGTRIEAKLETQISSAVLTPVVAVVEYTYAIGDRIVQHTLDALSIPLPHCAFVANSWSNPAPGAFLRLNRSVMQAVEKATSH
jgi:hypothetical protein